MEENLMLLVVEMVEDMVLETTAMMKALEVEEVLLI